MIPLQLHARVTGPQVPFVVRLKSAADRHSGTDGILLRDQRDAFLIDQWPDHLAFSFAGGKFELFGASEADVAGDILLVDPHRSIAQRLIRARSPHNTLLVTEQCDQLCVMCSQPPKKTHVDLFGYFASAVELAPQSMSVGLSGGEPTLHKHELFAFLQRAHTARPDLTFHVLTNAQHFDWSDLPFLRDSARWGICWGVPIYAASEADHDAIVGKSGAFRRLLDSLSVLVQAGAEIELRTVVMQNNAQELPRLARFVATHLSSVAVWAIMQLENAGYARNAWRQLFYDNSQSFDCIAEAIDIARARGLSVSLYNFPRCTVAPGYRDLAVRSISDWKQRYLAVCEECRERPACAGFFEWYPEKDGFKGIAAL